MIFMEIKRTPKTLFNNLDNKGFHQDFMIPWFNVTSRGVLELFIVWGK